MTPLRKILLTIMLDGLHRDVDNDLLPQFDSLGLTQYTRGQIIAELWALTYANRLVWTGNGFELL